MTYGILEANVRNYGTRAGSFGEWAETKSNADSAVFARGILLHELRRRRQAGLIARDAKIRILDIGHGAVLLAQEWDSPY